MPPVNQAVLASAGIIAVSVAVAAAIAVYESPELRRMADDFRRRIAIALHSLGDNVDPNSREPMFNRPEDAEGFLQSRGATNEGVDADDETRRRQREELMYWNAIRERREKEQRDIEGQGQGREFQGATFDDFMKPDNSGERGTYVFNTGADIGIGNDNVLRRRGTEGVRGLNATVYSNPFADENGVDDFDDSHPSDLISPEKDEMTDIYGATPLDGRTVQSELPSPRPAAPNVLFDFEDNRSQTLSTGPQATLPPLVELDPQPMLERQLADNEFMTAGQEDRHDAYASIQAWAENTTDHSSGRNTPNPMSFYSPLPVTPTAPLSEPEIISDGQLTPTDSASDIGTDLVSAGVPDEYDVMSQESDGEGLATPNSWSEVGSVISESDAIGAVHA